jgi:hypothetical protein
MRLLGTSTYECLARHTAAVEACVTEHMLRLLAVHHFAIEHGTLMAADLACTEKQIYLCTQALFCAQYRQAGPVACSLGCHSVAPV